MAGLTKIATKEYLTSQEGLEEISRLVSEEHASYYELTRIFGISERTLMNWMREEPKIRIAMQRGKVLMKPLVEDSLYDLCFEKKIYDKSITKDGHSEIKTSTIRERTRNQSLPAIQYVLNNISEGEWRTHQDITIDAMTRVPKVVHDDIGMFTDEELLDGNAIISQNPELTQPTTPNTNEVANNGKSVQLNGNHGNTKKTMSLDEF